MKTILLISLLLLGGVSLFWLYDPDPSEQQIQIAQQSGLKAGAYLQYPEDCIDSGLALPTDGCEEDKLCINRSYAAYIYSCLTKKVTDDPEVLDYGVCDTNESIFAEDYCTSLDDKDACESARIALLTVCSEI